MRAISSLSAMLLAVLLLTAPGMRGAENEKKKPCCEATVEAGKKCKHKCCVKAAEAGKVCETCHPKTDEKK